MGIEISNSFDVQDLKSHLTPAEVNEVSEHFPSQPTQEVALSMFISSH